MSTSASFNKEAQDALVTGLNLVSKAVGSTLGPAGSTVVFQEKDKPVVITKDGVTVAKQIDHKDEKVRLGAELAINISKKQLDSVGDGTTTACVLGNAIVNTGVRQIELSDAKVNRTAVRHGIEKARDYIVEKLVSLGTEVKTDEDLINIATVSANGDEKLGTVVAEAYQKVGKDGIVQVEETKDRDIHLEFKEGMTFDKGWTSQFFVNNPTDQTVEYENPKILLCESKITNFASLVEVIQNISSTGTPIVIIAESFDSSVTQALAMNIIRSGGQLKIACVEAPGYGDRRLDLLRDMAVYLGGCVADDPLGKKLEIMSPVDFGSCEKIIIKKDETIIRGGMGDPEQVKQRVDSLQGVMDNLKENDTFEKEKIGKRIAALTTGVAVIKVGGSSEEEIKELKDRLDDAQWAVKSALQSGYLPGGGTTLLHLSETVQENVQCSNNDEKLGVEIVARALKAPFRVILENAGVDPESTMNKVLGTKDVNIGYDARNLEVKNMIEAGIIDPVKVVTGSIYAATSIASVVLTSNVIITTDKEENKGVSLNMMPGGMM